MREAANRHHRSVERDRRDHRVDARAIRQPRIHHRARLVDAPPDQRHDLVDDAQQVLLVREGDVGEFQPTLALHVDLAIRVDQDVGDGRVGHQQLERAEAQHLVLDVADQRAPLRVVDHGLLFVQQPFDHHRNLVAQHVGRERFQRRQVEHVEQLQVDALLERLVGVAIGRWPGLHRHLDSTAIELFAKRQESLVAGQCGDRLCCAHVHALLKSRPSNPLLRVSSGRGLSASAKSTRCLATVFPRAVLISGSP